MLVEGRLTPDKETGGPRVWTAQDGSPKASFEVTATTVRFLSSRSETEASGAQAGGPADGSGSPADDGDTPF